jgi:hypothetical protein
VAVPVSATILAVMPVIPTIVVATAALPRVQAALQGVQAAEQLVIVIARHTAPHRENRLTG